MSLLAGMVAGADSIEDMDRLRHAGNGLVFDQIRAPSTLGTFLRAFTHGHVQQLNAVLRQALIALAGRVALAPSTWSCGVVVGDDCQVVLGGEEGLAEEAQWSAFVHQRKADYGFNPTLHGQVTAARKLGRRQGGWAQVWQRYAETPERYPGIPDQLRKARPEELIVEDPDVWPQDNEMAEDQLRKWLRDFEALTATGARRPPASRPRRP